jgi:hypothetical protein
MGLSVFVQGCAGQRVSVLTASSNLKLLGVPVSPRDLPRPKRKIDHRASEMRCVRVAGLTPPTWQIACHRSSQFKTRNLNYMRDRELTAKPVFYVENSCRRENFLESTYPQGVIARLCDPGVTPS